MILFIYLEFYLFRSLFLPPTIVGADHNKDTFFNIKSHYLIKAHIIKRKFIGGLELIFKLK
jgi:hypothetical protein